MSPPTFNAPPTPAPPDTTNAPVEVLELAVLSLISTLASKSAIPPTSKVESNVTAPDVFKVPPISNNFVGTAKPIPILPSEWITIR